MCTASFRFTDPRRTVVTVATTAYAAALVLCAAALIVLPERLRTPRARARVRNDSARGVLAGPGGRAIVAGSAVAAGTFLLFPERWWLSAGAGLLSGWLVGRRPRGRSTAARKADRTAVAVHTDLFAACLDAGMPVASALRGASEAMTSGGGLIGGLAERGVRGPERAQRGGADRMRTGPGDGRGRSGPLIALESVAAMLALGADPQTAWRAASSVDELAPIAAAARRSAAGGGGLAEAVREHGALLRADAAAADLRAAGRAGVLMTAPLGICFLPAFLCLGLAPVVVGLLGQLDIW